MTTPDLFDRATRRRRRDRIAPTIADSAFWLPIMHDGLAERLATVTRQFGDVLEIGLGPRGLAYQPGTRVARLDPGFAIARATRGVQGDEDRLPFADASFDLVVAAGTLDTVNDLPGALTLIRRILRPDGLFLGAMVAAGTLSTLRAALRQVEGERPVARLHPGVEVRAAGDLLMRAGFALPVADVETIDVRYTGVGRLFDDLRGGGAANVLTGRQPLSREVLAGLAQAYAARADADGRTTERLAMLFMTGWAPGPDQPQPARRGSGTASLADALRRTQ